MLTRFILQECPNPKSEPISLLKKTIGLCLVKTVICIIRNRPSQASKITQQVERICYLSLLTWVQFLEPIERQKGKTNSWRFSSDIYIGTHMHTLHINTHIILIHTYTERDGILNIDNLDKYKIKIKSRQFLKNNKYRSFPNSLTRSHTML